MFKVFTETLYTIRNSENSDCYIVVTKTEWDSIKLGFVDETGENTVEISLEEAVELAKVIFKIKE